MVSTSGAQLLQGNAVEKLRRLLLPITTILTPNIPEATLLLRDADIQFRQPTNLEDLKALAISLHSLGPRHILLKGGHLPLTKTYTKALSEDQRAITVDILYPSKPGGHDFSIIQSPYLNIPNTHGTGCSLASALSANISHSRSTPSSQPEFKSKSLPELVHKSISFVTNGIFTSPALQTTLQSRGAGPINHFHSGIISPYPQGHFIPHILSHPCILSTWQRYIHHPFATALGNGSLPISKFKQYLMQDYKYLTHFARAHALAGFKSTSMSHIASSAAMISAIQTEMEMHLSYCADFGITHAELDETQESTVCTAYSRWILDVGLTGDGLGLMVALASCLIGYNVVAERLAGNPPFPGTVANTTRVLDEVEVKKIEDMENRDKSNAKIDRSLMPSPPHHALEDPQSHPYSKWIETYTSQIYRDSVQQGIAAIENEITRLGGLGPGRVEELVEIFRRATELEIGFWDL
jgi:hydroxymethylpyrimidine kinase/phosphomethylpyrimidine kinase